MSIDEIRLSLGLPSQSLVSFPLKATEESIKQVAEGYKKDFQVWLSFNMANRKNKNSGPEKK